MAALSLNAGGVMEHFSVHRKYGIWMKTVFRMLKWYITRTLRSIHHLHLKQMRWNGLPWSEEKWHCYSRKDRRWRSALGCGGQMTEESLRWFTWFWYCSHTQHNVTATCLSCKMMWNQSSESRKWRRPFFKDRRLNRWHRVEANELTVDYRKATQSWSGLVQELIHL